jgi:hypothetical protein
LPQPLQLFESHLGSTHVPPQSIMPAGQPHALFEQTFPPVQMLPQPLQLVALVLVSTHALLQLVRFAPHCVVQTPELQTWFGPHAVVHRLQWAGSDVVSTHVPPQSVSPGGHWQVPLHTLPPVQVVPQPPQLAGSIDVFTHVPPQSVCPWGHWQEPAHCLPPVQAAPQLPQLALSEAVFTHVWPHRERPIAHPASADAPSEDVASSPPDESMPASCVSPSPPMLPSIDTSAPEPASCDAASPELISEVASLEGEPSVASESPVSREPESIELPAVPPSPPSGCTAPPEPPSIAPPPEPALPPEPRLPPVPARVPLDPLAPAEPVVVVRVELPPVDPPAPCAVPPVPEPVVGPPGLAASSPPQPNIQRPVTKPSLANQRIDAFIGPPLCATSPLSYGSTPRITSP